MNPVRDIIKKIQDPIILYLIASLLITVGLGVYDINKTKELKVIIIVIFITGCILIFAIERLKYQRDNKNCEMTNNKDLEKRIEILKKENKELNEQIEECDHKIKLDKDLDNYVGNLNFKIHHPEVVDNDHFYDKVTFFAQIDHEGNYIGKYQRFGKRIKPGITHYLVLQLGASHPIIYNQLELKAINLKDNKQLDVESIDDSKSYLKVFKILFDTKINNGEDIKVEWNFRWPCCVSQKKDGDTVNLMPYKAGLKEIYLEYSFPFKIKRPFLQEVKNNKFRDSKFQFNHFEKDKLHFYACNLCNVKADGLLFTWTRPG